MNLDDETYITNNSHVASGITAQNIAWAVTSVEAANWHPVTWLSHMADVQFYGLNPRGHHLTNVAIHAFSALLLFLLLLRMASCHWQSLFVAALFALHPLHVESVAWVAERKDVLSAFFWFLTLLFYAEYVAKQKPALYILALFSFVLGLMSKPMLVTLPVVMLLMDFWPLSRFQDEEQKQGVHHLSGRAIPFIKEKIPFFLCSVFSGIVTIYAQNRGGAMPDLHVISFPLRIENALIAYVQYIGKTVWPRDLAHLYPFPLSIPIWQVIGSLFILLLLSAASIRVWQRHPYIAVGWFWFIITLVPVIGLLQVGSQSMADRYSYIPLVGLFIMAAWGVPELTKGLQYRQAILALLAGVTIIVSAVLTQQQLGYWRDNISLNRHTLQVTTGNYIVHNHLGEALFNNGQLDAAIKEYQESLRINPFYSDAHNNLGNALAKTGEQDAAYLEFQESLKLNPNNVMAHNNLGIALQTRGDLDGAIQEFRKILRISPLYSDAHNNLGLALAGKGDLDGAIQEFQKTLQISPNDKNVHYNIGLALARKGDLDGAIQEYQKTLRINPNDKNAHNNLGVVLDRKGDLDGAIQEYQEALLINPSDTDVHNNLSLALAQKRMRDLTRK